MVRFQCAAVLFDLDGVLVDSTASVTRVWTHWAREHALDPAHVIEIAHGRRTIDTVELLAPDLDATSETNLIEAREIADTDGLRSFDRALGLLASLPANRWAVVTSGTRALATARLSAAGLPVPAALITADEVSNGKPNPEPYLKGAAALGISPETCLVIEDAPSGIEAAHAARMKAIAVPTTYPIEQLRNADLLVAKLADLEIFWRGRLIEVEGLPLIQE
jgi:sugar-phosphatase